MNQSNESFPEANSWFPYLKEKEVAVFELGNAFVETFEVKILLSVLLGIIVLFSVVGNVCTCVVVARIRTMRTPTNCYLVNLAVIDLIITLFAPVEIYNFWRSHHYPFGELGCQLQVMLWDCLSNCSVLTIVAFTVERYLVVSKPFLRQKLAFKSRVYKIIALNWLISLVFSVPSIFYIKLFDKNNYVCCYFGITDVFKIMLPVLILVFFIIPMTIIFVLYILIAIKLKSTQLKLSSKSAKLNQNRDRAVKMLAAVAASFFLCWAPYCMLRMMLLGPKSFIRNNYNTWRVMYSIFNINICISTAINPVLYSLMSGKFRQAFKAILKGDHST